MAEDAAARTAQESDEEDFVHLPAEPQARCARDDTESDVDSSDDGHGEQMGNQQILDEEDSMQAAKRRRSRGSPAVGFSAQSLIAMLILVLALWHFAPS